MSCKHLDTAPSLEQRARRRVAMKKGLFIHAVVFVLVNAGLWLASTVGGFGRWHGGGAFFPLWGWALGLTIHAIVVFLKLQGEGVGQRMVEREIETLRRREGH